MKISRRYFLSLCGASSAAIATASLWPEWLPAQMAGGTTKVIWLQGSGCTGCSISFLNLISEQAPQTVDDVLLDVIQLNYHPNLSSAFGDTAVSGAEAVFAEGNYILAVEGGVPTAFDGAACWAWTLNGREHTFLEVVQRYASRAAGILCVGTCASFGGIPAAYPNPTGVVGVGTATGRPTINVAGCPVHPDWLVWTVATVLSGARMELDDYRRPKALYEKEVHGECPRRELEKANSYGVDRLCLRELGCKGPQTGANCPNTLWNGGQNWCVDANAPCIGCTEPGFPLTGLMALERLTLSVNLSPAAAYPGAAGRATFEDRYEGLRLNVDATNLGTVQSVVFRADGIEVARSFVNAYGQANCRLQSKEGDFVPYLAQGSLIQVVNSSNGAIILSGRFPAENDVSTGSVSVTITPQEAVTAEARWNLDGGPLQVSGAVVTGVATGSHTISFSSVSGWVTPANQLFNVTAGQTTTISGSYTKQATDIRLEARLSPTLVDPKAAGSARYEVHGSRRRFRVDIKNVSSTRSVAIRVNGATLGTVRLSSGAGRLERDTDKGHTVPQLAVGALIEVVNAASGALILTGRLSQVAL